jgi:PhnB protein
MACVVLYIVAGLIALNRSDSAYEQALEAGAISLSTPEDKFWGARSALIKDPFGYRSCLTQKIEEVSPEEMA